ncbi:patatin-like phospholipase family protein [Micromonospora soli]|uniref:patatin-like phospholipase family protein n=1 Tax=Micromonospora sp. NBRC 110009 TaxID=3061627 RepID=UPI002672EAA9|nr:patatin-like phospholipase family protein [Micromonospora sp. NBRC 110009]WKT98478.1 patatin-like phospholipase family protein [Micromonospora sp. NBRC 110009]
MRIALALGAGGARGYAHIGVVQILEERGFDIIAVAGSSMGALVGGLYAAGKLDAYADWVRTVGQRDVLRLLDPRAGAPGAIRAEKLMARVRELLDGVRIEQLPVPFTAVATDLLARRAVWFQRGPVDVAVRASIALPPAITPVMVNGRLLADGGLMEPVPMAPTTTMPADAVVAVCLKTAGADFRPRAAAGESAHPPEPGGRNHPRGPAGLVDQLISRGGPSGDGSGAADAAAETITTDDGGPGQLPANLHVSDVISLSLEAVRDLLIRYQLASYPPDVLIEVPTEAVRTYEFHRATEMIEIGRRAALDALASSPLA